MNRDDKQGFTLIELAIVLVVVGLVTAGVLVGRDLVRSAEIRSQVSELQTYNSATSTFLTKYGYLPGDIPVASATQFGLYVNATCGGALVCMNGNGFIEPYTGGCGAITSQVGSGHIPLSCGTGTVGEPSIFFRHLTDAKLIKGNISFTGATWEAGGQYLPLTVGRGGIVSMGCFYTGSGVCYFLGVATVSGQSHFVNANATQGAMTTATAFMLDTKIDDGVPTTGLMQAAYVKGTWGIYKDNAQTTCTILSSGKYIYDLTAGDTICQLMLQAKL